MKKNYPNFKINASVKTFLGAKFCSVLLLIGFFLVANNATAAIAPRGTSTTATSNTTTLTIAKPTGVVTGDIMFVTIAQIGTNTLSSPTSSGWTLVTGADLLGGTNRWGAVLYKVATGIEPASYTFTLDTQSSRTVGSIVAFSGINTAAPFDVASAALSVQGSQTGVSATTRTSATANAAVVMFGMAAGSAPTWSGWNTASPGTLTELFDNQYTGNATVGAAWALKATIGATGTGTATLSSNERNGGVLVILRPNPVPTVTSFSPTSACAGTTPTVIITGTNFTGATAVSFNGTAATPFTINSATQITTTLPLGATTGTVSVTTPTGTGASASNFTINPYPTVVGLTGPSAVCVGGNILLSSTTPGGAWSSSSNAIATVVGGTVTGVAYGSATITYTVTSAGCSTSVQKTITVNALPVLSGMAPLCVGSTLQLSPSSGGTWTANNGSIASITSGGLISGLLEGNATFTFLDATTNCSSTTSAITINAPAAITTQPVTQTVCSGANSVQFSVAATGTSLTYQWYNGAISLTNGGNISGAASNTLTLNPILLTDAGNYHCVVTSTLCGSPAVSNDATLTVIGQVAITSQPAITQTFCVGDSATFALTATGTGMSYQWYKSATLIPGAVNPTYTITPLVSADAASNYHCIVTGTSPCSAVNSNNAALIINDAPAIGLQPVPTQTVCAGTSVSISVNATGGTLTYQWYKGATALTNGGNISGAISATLIINPTSPSDSASNYHCIIQNGCVIPVDTNNSELVVNDTPYIFNSTTSVCSEATFTVAPLNGNPTIATIVPAGTNYSWSVPTVTGGLTGGASGANQSAISGTLTNPTNIAQTATYTVTPVSGTTGNCVGNIFTIVVTVNPKPFIINSSPVVCSGENLVLTPTNGSGNIVPIGTTYSWTSPVVSGGMIGGTSGSNQPSINITLNNPTNTVQTASYNVTATSGSCLGSTFTLALNVNPKPTVAANITSQTICSGDAMAAVAPSNPNNVAGTIYYSWTRDNNANVTGMAASGNGSVISGNLTNTTTTQQTVTFSLTAMSDQGCISTILPVTVTVNPKPTVAASPLTQTVCSGNSITNINITNPNNVVGTSLTWTRDNNVNLTGIAASGNGNISGALTNNTSVQQTTTFTITAAVSGCSNVINTVTVTVNPKPDVLLSPSAAQSLCGGIAFTAISLSNPNAVSGTTFNWTRNNTVNLTGYANSAAGVTSIPSGIFTNNTNVDQTTTFTVTATAAGCPSVASTVDILVKPAPLVTATPASQTKCNSVAITTINLATSNSLAGTTYSWTRDKTVELTGIAASGSGTSITGTLTNTTTLTQTTTFTITALAPNGCSKIITATITVYAPLAAPVIGSAQTVCILSTPAAITITTPASGGSGTYTYQWQSSADNVTFNNIAGATGAAYQPPFVNAGDNDVFYRLVVTNLCGTITSTSVFVEVVSSVGFTFGVNDGLSGAICSGTAFTPTINSIHFYTSAVRFSWTANPAYITPATGGPVGTTGGAVFIIRTSSASIGPLTAVNNTNATVNTTVSITPSVYNYPGPPSGAFICSVTPQIINVTIRPIPVANAITPNVTICSGTSANIAVTGNITDATMSYNWTRTNGLVTGTTSGTSGTIAIGGTFTLNNILTNTTAIDQDVVYSFTPVSNGCSGTPVTVSVKVAPAVTPGTVAASQTICSGDIPAPFTQSVAATGNNLTYQWQSSTDNVTYNNIAGATGTTYSAGAISQTTWFIRVVSSTLNSFTCSVANTTPIVITVNNINPGTISGSQTVCANTGPVSLTSATPATGSGAISYQWQSNTTGCGGVWADIAGATGINYSIPGGLATTTYFRRKAASLFNSVSCSAYSSCITVTVNTLTGGTVGSDQTLCGNNPAAFTEITPSTGMGVLSYQWQISTDNITYTNINLATTATYDPPAGVTVVTYYRRMTTSTLNSVSCTALSNYITVTPNAVTAGIISGNRTVCNGGNPAAFTVVVPATGANITYQWQISTTGGAGPWTNISGATNATYDEPGPMTQTSYYQCVVMATLNSSTCNATTNFVTVFVNDVTAGTVSGNQSVCGIQDPNAFTVATAATANGVISYQWQKSTIDCSSGWSDISGATTATYDPPVLTQTTYYHVVVTSTLNSIQCSAISNCITVICNAKVWNGSISANWNTPGNWSPNGVPTTTDCVVVPNVGALPFPVISGAAFNAYAYNVAVMNGGHLQVNSSNTITATDAINIQATGQFNIKDGGGLVQINNTSNSGNINMERITQPIYRFDYTYWGSPVTLASNFTLGNTGGLSPGTLSDKFFSWTPTISNGFGGWAYETAASVMVPGKGYIVRAPQSFSFTAGTKVPYTANFIGTPNNGDILCPIYHGLLGAGNNNDKYNLLGNPYPSAVNATSFLNDPANVPLIDGTIYFWTHNSPPSTAYPDPFYGDFVINYTDTDYASWNALGGTGTAATSGGSTPNGYIAAGQGFFAKSTGTAPSGNSVIFKNSMRATGNNGQFFRLNDSATFEKHRVWINLVNSLGNINQVLVGYAEGATTGLDRSFDGVRISETGLSLYSIVENKNLVIQGRPLPFNINDQVPLGYKAPAASTYSIRIDHLDGLFDEQNVYVEDRMLNVIHNIKESPYVFDSAAGEFNERFVLRYTDNLLSVLNPESTVGFTALLFDGKLEIKARENIRDIRIYDITGKLVDSYTPEMQRNIFESDFNFAEGIYLVKIRFEDGRIASQKLINSK